MKLFALIRSSGSELSSWHKTVKVSRILTFALLYISAAIGFICLLAVSALFGGVWSLSFSFLISFAYVRAYGVLAKSVHRVLIFTLAPLIATAVGALVLYYTFVFDIRTTGGNGALPFTLKYLLTDRVGPNEPLLPIWISGHDYISSRIVWIGPVFCLLLCIIHRHLADWRTGLQISPDSLQKYAAATQSIVVAVGLLAAGGWALLEFVISRKLDLRLDLKLEASAERAFGDYFINATVTLSNTGSLPLSLVYGQNTLTAYKFYSEALGERRFKKIRSFGFEVPVEMENKTAIGHVNGTNLAAGSSVRIPYRFSVKEAGSYYLHFRVESQDQTVRVLGVPLKTTNVTRAREPRALSEVVDGASARLSEWNEGIFLTIPE